MIHTSDSLNFCQDFLATTSETWEFAPLYQSKWHVVCTTTQKWRYKHNLITSAIPYHQLDLNCNSILNYFNTHLLETILPWWTTKLDTRYKESEINKPYYVSVRLKNIQKEGRGLEMRSTWEISMSNSNTSTGDTNVF